MSSSTFILTTALLKLKNRTYYFTSFREDKTKGFHEVLSLEAALEKPGSYWHPL